MIVLTASTDSQFFHCIPRSGDIVGMFIKDEQTNGFQEITILSVVVGDYTTIIEAEFELIEGHSYVLMLDNGATSVFYDKIFCTDQPKDNYSMNKDNYVNKVSQNEFIVYE